jgi:hypothetical protein
MRCGATDVRESRRIGSDTQSSWEEEVAAPRFPPSPERTLRADCPTLRSIARLPARLGGSLPTRSEMTTMAALQAEGQRLSRRNRPHLLRPTPPRPHLFAPSLWPPFAPWPEPFGSSQVRALSGARPDPARPSGPWSHGQRSQRSWLRGPALDCGRDPSYTSSFCCPTIVMPHRAAAVFPSLTARGENTYLNLLGLPSER